MQLLPAIPIEILLTEIIADESPSFQLRHSSTSLFSLFLLEQAGPYREQVERAVGLRRRGRNAPNIYTACAEARRWQEEQAKAAGR